MSVKYILTVQCNDRAGVIADIATLISGMAGNILDFSQHSALDVGVFLARIRFEVPDAVTVADFATIFQQIAEKYNMDWRIYPENQKLRAAILVSKTRHTLYELLLKHQDGQLNCDFPVIISNHSDLAGVATQFHIPFYQVDPAKGKQACEADINQILKEYSIDLVILARYMQILSKEFTDRWSYRVINIHHGFLPAFMGAKPYHQAWYKGVKLIGATAHFANENLDQGPIIAQDVIHVQDTMSIAEFILKGQDVERKVLFEAVKLYLEHRVFVVGGRTFILD